MKVVYPVILQKGDQYILVRVPDLDLVTQGKDWVDALAMARDVICLTAVELQDDGQIVPVPSSIESFESELHEIVTLVDVDFDEYRAWLDNRSIRKNCTLPSWLNARAEKANIIFSSSAGSFG
jgi:predicted RNase H-like HicB family nuclease